MAVFWRTREVINISDLARGDVLAALINHAAGVRVITPIEAEHLCNEQEAPLYHEPTISLRKWAKELWHPDGAIVIESANTTVVQIWIEGDTIGVNKYDDIYGKETAEKVIADLRVSIQQRSGFPTTSGRRSSVPYGVSKIEGSTRKLTLDVQTVQLKVGDLLTRKQMQLLLEYGENEDLTAETLGLRLAAALNNPLLGHGNQRSPQDTVRLCIDKLAPGKAWTSYRQEALNVALAEIQPSSSHLSSEF